MLHILHMHWLWFFGALALGIAVGFATYQLAATHWADRHVHIGIGAVVLGVVLIVARLVPVRYGYWLELAAFLSIAYAIGCLIGWALRDIADFAPAAAKTGAGATARAQGTYLFPGALAGFGAGAAFMRTSADGGPGALRVRMPLGAGALTQAPIAGGYTFPKTLPFADATTSRAADAVTGTRRHWSWQGAAGAAGAVSPEFTGSKGGYVFPPPVASDATVARVTREGATRGGQYRHWSWRDRATPADAAPMGPGAHAPRTADTGATSGPSGAAPGAGASAAAAPAAAASPATGVASGLRSDGSQQAPVGSAGGAGAAASPANRPSGTSGGGLPGAGPEAAPSDGRAAVAASTTPASTISASTGQTSSMPAYTTPVSTTSSPTTPVSTTPAPEAAAAIDGRQTTSTGGGDIGGPSASRTPGDGDHAAPSAAQGGATSRPAESNASAGLGTTAATGAGAGGASPTPSIGGGTGTAAGAAERPAFAGGGEGARPVASPGSTSAESPTVAGASAGSGGATPQSTRAGKTGPSATTSPAVTAGAAAPAASVGGGDRPFPATSPSPVSSGGDGSAKASAGGSATPASATPGTPITPAASDAAGAPGRPAAASGTQDAHPATTSSTPGRTDGATGASGTSGGGTGSAATPASATTDATGTAPAATPAGASATAGLPAAPPSAPGQPATIAAVPGEDKHAGERPEGLMNARDNRADDLKRIRGIGPQNEGRLHGLGIWHFDQIAAWTPDNVRWVGSYLAFPGRIDRERWVEQATTLAGGGDTEFSQRMLAGKVATSPDDGRHGQSNIDTSVTSRPRRSLR